MKVIYALKNIVNSNELATFVAFNTNDPMSLEEIRRKVMEIVLNNHGQSGLDRLVGFEVNQEGVPEVNIPLAIKLNNSIYNLKKDLSVSLNFTVMELVYSSGYRVDLHYGNRLVNVFEIHDNEDINFLEHYGHGFLTATDLIFELIREGMKK